MNRGPRASYFCFDCGKATKAVTGVNRNGSFAFVCSKGTGCHRTTSPYDPPKK